MAARGVFRPTPRRTPSRDSRVRSIPVDARQRRGALLPGARVRASRRSRAPSSRMPGRDGPKRLARREIAGILEVLGKLHRGQMLHRDLTPLNVFVCDGRRLKLGDFGIVRQQSDTPWHHRAHHERVDRAERHPRTRRPEVAGARRRVSGRTAAGNADQGRRTRAHSPARSPPAVVQRSPQGDRLPLHRRAAEAVRERRRNDRRARAIRPPR